MLENSKFLAIIPARGGSKRLPRKNVLELEGKPLIAWTIEAAIQSKYIDKILVTSDDKEILDAAEKLAVDSIVRPAELANDSATTFDAIKHAIENTAGDYDYIVLLQPTSPFRASIHIDEAIELLFEKRSEAIVSVSEVEHSPLWTNTLPDDGSLEGFISDDVKNKRSQDLPKFYALNGAIYICKRRRLLTEKTFFIKNRISAYIMNTISSIDIDTWLDFKLAEVVVKEDLI